jgi:hypothetical protein
VYAEERRSLSSMFLKSILGGSQIDIDRRRCLLLEKCATGRNYLIE